SFPPRRSSDPSVSTRPEEMVLATAVPMNAPIRFMVAARITAWPGDSTLVATTVAMELAVSWKPLMNSNTRAASTTTRTRASIESMRQDLAVLQPDFVGDHAGLAAAVDRLLEDLEEFLEQEHLRSLQAPGIDVPVQLQDQAVGLVLQHPQLVAELLHRLQAKMGQLLHHLHHHRSGLFQHRRARGEIDALQALAGQGIAVGDALDLHGDLVQGRGQGLDVLALDRGGEPVDQRLADLLGGVALALAGQLESVQGMHPARLAEHGVEGPGAVVGGVGRLVKEGIELLALPENGLEGEHERAGPLARILAKGSIMTVQGPFRVVLPARGGSRGDCYDPGASFVPSSVAPWNPACWNC